MGRRFDEVINMINSVIMVWVIKAFMIIDQHAAFVPHSQTTKAYAPRRAKISRLMAHFSIAIQLTKMDWTGFFWMKLLQVNEVQQHLMVICFMNLLKNHASLANTKRNMSGQSRELLHYSTTSILSRPLIICLMSLDVDFG